MKYKYQKQNQFGLNNPNFDKKHSGLNKGNTNGRYTDGRYLKKYFCINCEIEISKSSGIYGNGRCNKCKGVIHSKKMLGQNNPAYIDGRSFENYPQEFNDGLKEQIQKRDNYECQGEGCNITQEEHFIIYGRDLEIHHIDYDKQNCDKYNLTTLCKQCNLRANFNKDYWFAYFTYITEII